MTLRDYTANVISATKVVPDGNFKDSKASGVWDINEALDLIKGGNWPNAANLNPSSFVDGVFSCDLYKSDGSSTQTITNNIDLSGKGGLVWLKERTTARNHVLVDTERVSGVTDNYLFSNTANVQVAHTNEFGDFTSTGYTVPYNTEAGYTNITSSRNYSGWTFRKQPKFFDVVTYTGTGSAQAIAHNLGSVPGMIITKGLDTAYNWGVFHRSIGNTKALILDVGNAANTGTSFWNDTNPTSTHFTVGNDNTTNDNGENYVAYLFAHNDDDGGFGETEDQDIIKCDSFTGNSSTKPTIDLGFEPQWLMLKNASSANQDWHVIDTTRGWYNGTGVSGSGGVQDARFRPNATNAEETTFGIVEITPTGFKLGPDQLDETNKNGDTIVYMAIRRGGMQTPTSASDVFHVQSQSNADSYSVGFQTDLILLNKTGGSSANTYVGSRLLGNGQYLKTNTTTAESTSAGLFTFDGAPTKYDFDQGASTSSAWVGYHWARARGFCDVVCYTGTGSARTVTHNLGVVPEMFWVKSRDASESWAVFHKNIGNGFQTVLNLANAPLSDSTSYNNTDPTSSVFTVGTNDQLNKSGDDYIAFLFATIANVSKVGSFTQSGATNVDCGFTGDTPSFILFKRTDSTGSWYVFDSARGIIAGNDPYFFFNTTDAQVTNEDLVDPYSGGFATTSSLTNGDYIFYAIAAIS